MSLRLAAHYKQQFELLKNKFKISEEDLGNLSFLKRNAIVDGLPLEVVNKLSDDRLTGDDQLTGIVKFGLSENEVSGLGFYEIRAYLNLRHRHQNREEFLKQLKISPLKTSDHLAAFGYLTTIIKIDAYSALEMLKQCSTMTAAAIRVGLIPSILDVENSNQFPIKLPSIFFDFSSSNESEIKAKISAKKLSVITDLSDSTKFNNTQLNLLKEFSYWGLTENKIAEYDWIKHETQGRAIITLMHGNFFEFEQAAAEIKDLELPQLSAILEHGLLRKDVVNLNEYQIDAIVRVATHKNGLCAAWFNDKPWFKSGDHVTELAYLHQAQGLTLEDCFEQLKNQNKDQLNALPQSKTKKEVTLSIGHSTVFSEAPRTVAPTSTVAQTNSPTMERGTVSAPEAPRPPSPPPFG